MTDQACEWTLSNPGPTRLAVWLEPWAEEFIVPPRSTITLRAAVMPESVPLAEFEWSPEHLIVWANASTLEVLIDEVLQESASALIPVPEGLTKSMLSLMFTGQPAARLGGTPIAERTSWWTRLLRRVGL